MAEIEDEGSVWILLMVLVESDAVMVTLTWDDMAVVQWERLVG